jgi:hypothetical protein
VKCQLAIVAVDSDIVEVLRKMPYILTNAKYAAILYVYGFCDTNATASVEEYCQQFPMRSIPDCRVFFNVFNTLCEHGALPSAHVSSE